MKITVIEKPGDEYDTFTVKPVVGSVRYDSLVEAIKDNKIWKDDHASDSDVLEFVIYTLEKLGL